MLNTTLLNLKKYILFISKKKANFKIMIKETMNTYIYIIN